MFINFYICIEKYIADSQMGISLEGKPIKKTILTFFVLGWFAFPGFYFAPLVLRISSIFSAYSIPSFMLAK